MSELSSVESHFFVHFISSWNSSAYILTSLINYQRPYFNDGRNNTCLRRTHKLANLQLYYTRFSTNPATRMAGLPKAHHTENKELARIHNELSWMPSNEKHDSVDFTPQDNFSCVFGFRIRVDTHSFYTFYLPFHYAVTTSLSHPSLCNYVHYHLSGFHLASS